MDLDSLALQYHTDKASDGHNYTAVYESLFEPIRNRALVLLELGVDRGQSMQLWSDYFRNSLILGVDNREDPQRQLDHLSRVIVFDCDQADERLPELVAEYYPFDIVIDDCSHIVEKTVASFKMLWPMIPPGGWYIIEDVGAQPDDDGLLLKALDEAGSHTRTWHPSCHPAVPHFSLLVVRKSGE